jgi:hypothetical protein
VPNGSFGVTHQFYTDRAAFLGGEAALLGLTVISGALVTAAAVRAVSDIYLDRPASVGSSLRYALRRLPAVIGLEIIIWTGVIGAVFGLFVPALAIVGRVWGLVLLIIPAVIIYVLWSMAMPALLLERHGPARALGRSSKLVQSRWWATFAVQVVAVLMTTGISIIIGLVLRAVASAPAYPSVLFAVIVTTATGAVSAIVTKPFSAAVTTVLYYDLRVRREGFDLQVLVDQLDLTSTANRDGADGALPTEPLPYGPEAVGRPGGPPFWPPPVGWVPSGVTSAAEEAPAPAYDPNEPLPDGPAAVGRPGGPPFWPPPAGWIPPPGWSPGR